MIRHNISDLERLLRVIFGVYAMLLGFLFISGLVGNLLGFLGLLLAITGAMGWSGIYTLLGRELPAVVGPAAQAETAVEAAAADAPAADRDGSRTPEAGEPSEAIEA
ncbi:MAG TPA: DUF2892 domain-containing protein [Anaerolineae bacterium]|nr:DUF2892 domain-containing protein [Anaerolineae bacterium]HUM35908.1 DUF2892 domain-containing protein [Anaerolineae bacterium]